MQHYILGNRKGTQATITNHGATLMGLRVADRMGVLDEVVLGFDDPEAYATAGGYPGAIVGRFANRIAKGRFSLADATYQLAVNNGPNHLHGGSRGFDKVLWTALPVDTALVKREGDGLLLGYVSPDGEEGYPGKLTVQVLYTLTERNELWIDYTATCDQPTIVNLSNHAYFNLAGSQSADILDHRLRLQASCFAPVDATMIPTGELRPVAHTPFDFRHEQRIGAALQADDPQLQLAHGFDHSYLIDGEPPALRLAAEVHDPSSGRTLEVRTTQPGVQFYTGNFFPGAQLRRHPCAAARHAGFCLEAQHFPDAPNQPAFASPRLAPAATYRQTTVYRFGIKP